MARYKITFWKLYFEQKKFMRVTYITESKLGLEHNQKFSERRTLTIEHDQI